ncbi:hypothetical protein YB2330_002229 [Saitoella coloradoensis]
MPRFIQVKSPGSGYTLTTRPKPTPSPSDLLLRVLACGLCGGDEVSRQGLMPNMTYPLIPGHEVIGVIEEIGAEVRGERWKVGDLVGCGWHAGHCGVCDVCRKGNYISCSWAHATGATRDGGMGEYISIHATAAVSIPASYTSDPVAAAPLLCAGLTVFNCIRNGGAVIGDVVAVTGIGGLGHLAIQYCAKAGFHTVAISSSSAKREDAMRLGAHTYIDASTESVEDVLRRLGGAKLVIATAPSCPLILSASKSLALNGSILIVAEPAPDPASSSSVISANLELLPLMLARSSVRGWTAGIPADNEECLRASEMLGVKCEVQRWPLERAEEAYREMRKAKFRHVIDMSM